MHIGEDFLSGIERHGTDKHNVIKYLQELRENLINDPESKDLIAPLDRIINSYIDLSYYTNPDISVLKNLEKRLEKIIPVMKRSLIFEQGDNEKAILAILQNYESLGIHTDRNFLERVSIFIKKSFLSPLDKSEEE